MTDTASNLARELSLAPNAVNAVLELAKGGATVPFLARYRKEATGGLDETQIRAILERHQYLTELEARRATILEAIESDGKLTPELRDRLQRVRSKTELEDLYLPFKKKRRTKATIARELGLEPLALLILGQTRKVDRSQEARKYLSPDVPDEEQAWSKAQDIVAEVVAERPDVTALARRVFFETGRVTAKLTKSEDLETSKFATYAGFSESVVTIPSHRYLALRRGEAEKALKVTFEVDEDRLLHDLERLVGWNGASPLAADLRAAIRDGFQRLLGPRIETDLSNELKRRADDGAISVFASNLESLLLAAPLGEKTVLGMDPGLRTGVKCAVVDATGKVVAHTTIHPLTQQREARKALVTLLGAHKPAAIAIGNGTGSRETSSFVQECLRESTDPRIPVVSVNEAGASVYSASDAAREEFPDLDVTIRGAISIARRLQDPLAELVKIEPQALGVGQYQHDVSQAALEKKLDDVVETCVNRVGVGLNTASTYLLSYVSGIGPKLAKKIVEHRDQKGAFRSRKALLEVPGMGPKTFEQAAGFLRVANGEHPLDGSAVHPERYKLAERIAKDRGLPLDKLVGKSEVLKTIDPKSYVSADVGLPTLMDMLTELEKPGRDPRSSFEAPKFREDVSTLEDLREGMVLEGVVTNVTQFGAFVDVGVHQDGLIHISELADRFVRDPREVVKPGDKVKVRVLGVDLARKRIALSAKRA